MVGPQTFLDLLGREGVDTILSLPCSAFSGLLSALEANPQFDDIRATSEAEIVGIAAGAWMAGRNPAILIQNSGFCDAINPICSLLQTFRIHVPFFVSVRGGFGVKDEPQHDIVGGRFLSIVESLGLPSAVLPASTDAMSSAIESIFQRAADSVVVVAVPLGTFASGEGSEVLATDTLLEASMPVSAAAAASCPERVGDCGFRRAVLGAVRRNVPASSIFVCSTGYIGRDMFELGDAPSQIYVAGSMGCASAIGFGLSRYTDRLVVVLDGDGAALMRLGNMATVGAEGVGRLMHVVLNNGVYESTGGQRNFARSVDFAMVARACGYAVESTRVTSTEQLETLIIDAVADRRRGSPILFDTLISARSPKPCARPDVSYPDQARRLRALLQEDREAAALDVEAA